MELEIKKIPEIPSEIFEAIDRDRLAVFVGAGVSRLYGCQDWKSLGHNIIDKCRQEGIINFRLSEELKLEQDNKKVITIGFRLLEQAGKTEMFYESLEEALRPDHDHNCAPNLLKNIYQLRGVFVTTNYDDMFDQYFSKENIFRDPRKIRPSDIGLNKLFHIHGHIQERDSLVFKVSQYLDLYRDDAVSAFLRKLFLERHILFIGYGLAELELLDYLRSKVAPGESQNYLLEGFYRGQEQQVLNLQLYYEELGINVIPYEKDEIGYCQLGNVLDKWSRDVFAFSQYNLQSQMQIDEAVENVY